MTMRAASEKMLTIKIFQGNPMLIIGKCHCGNIAFTLDWPEDQPVIPARACNCSFCTKQRWSWTFQIRVQSSRSSCSDQTSCRNTRFGTETAAFHVCTRCGTVPIVTSEIADHLYASSTSTPSKNVDPSRLHRANCRIRRRGRGLAAGAAMQELDRRCPMASFCFGGSP